MTTDHLPSLLLKLTDPGPRRDSARALAARLGAEDLIVFVQDPELDVLLPAPGFPQTLSCGRAWRAFLDERTGPGQSTAELCFPDPATRKAARGITAEDGSVLVLLGGRPSPADVAEVSALLPYLAVVLRTELAALGAASRATLAQQAAQRTEALARELEASRRELQAVVASLHQAQAETGLIHRLTAAVNRAETLEQVVEPALAAIQGALRVERSAVLLVDADGTMRFEAWRGLSETYRRAVEGHSPWLPGERAPSSVLVGDVETDAALADFLPVFRSEGIRALGFIPLLYGDRLLGKFMFYSEEPRNLSDHEVRLAQTIADHVARAVGRTRDARERDQLIAELNRTVRLGEMFVGILGHDLRNPLNSIVMATHLLMSSGMEKGSKTASRILSNADRMARMIDQLLDVTRIRLGQGLPLEPRPVDLAEVCRSVVEELELANPSREIRLETSGNTVGTWDADRLGQMISNLVSNALQHGVADTPIDVRIDGTTAPDTARLEVLNRGVIPQEILPVLFEPFRATGESRTQRGSSGLGLGLYIAQQIAMAHGGLIEVQSSETEAGTRSVVEIPRIPGAHNRVWGKAHMNVS